MSTDKKALLNQLKIDRDQPAAQGSRKRWLFPALIAFVGLGGIAVWITFSAPSAQAVQVETLLVRAASSERAADSVLDATGYVVARRQATVSSKATGKVVEVLIEEGLDVQAGQLLARLDDSIPRAQYELGASRLAAAEASLAELRVALKQARLDLDRTQNLAQRNLASQADLDRDALTLESFSARLARAQSEIVVAERAMAVQQQMLEDMQIRAPFAGIVIAKAAQPGEMISPVSAGGGFTRTGICTIVDMDSLEIEVDVNEAYINRVSQGQAAAVTLNAYPGQPFPARVIATIPAADRNKATVRVRVGLLEKDPRVLPDMGVRVAFLQGAEGAAPADTAAPGVLVPSASIHARQGDNFVFVVEQGVAKQRQVRIGAGAGDQVRVVAGLSAGERIVQRLDKQMLGKLHDGVRVVSAGQVAAQANQ